MLVQIRISLRYPVFFGYTTKSFKT